MLLFNFKTDFSVTQLFSSFAHPEDGPSKQDILLYIFTWSLLGKQFRRGPAENAAKDLMVKLITQYATRGLDNTREYPLCTNEIIERDGMCPYLVVERYRDDVKLSYSNKFDFQSAAIFESLGN